MKTVALYAGINAIILVILSIYVTIKRAQHGKVEFGDGGHDDLQRAIRAQGNNVEYVPIALILMTLLVLIKPDGTCVHSTGIALTAARLIHAFGLICKKEIGRIIGAGVTWLTILCSAGCAIYYSCTL